MSRRVTNSQREVGRQLPQVTRTVLHFALESSAHWSMVNPNFDARFFISVTVMQKSVVLVFLLQNITKRKYKERTTVLLLVSYISTYNSTHMQTGNLIQCHDAKFCETSVTLTLLTSKPSPSPNTNNNYNLYMNSSGIKDEKQIHVKKVRLFSRKTPCKQSQFLCQALFQARTLLHHCSSTAHRKKSQSNQFQTH